MIRKILYATLASAALAVGAAPSRRNHRLVGLPERRRRRPHEEACIDEFNKEHAGKIKIEATTLEWGMPFYTKVQTSTAIGAGSRHHDLS